MLDSMDEPHGLWRPDHAAYADLCRSWNLAVTHRPDYVLAAESAVQVQQAVRFAASRRLPVRVQSAGHGALVPASGGLLIVTSGLNEVLIDPDTSSAVVGAGVKWRAVMDAAHPNGLAPLVGSSSDVGAVGFSLGGGLSFLSRKYGLAADAIVDAQVVTADGDLRWVDDEHDPDLMWALRGGGPNFGVVTALRTRLFPLAQIYAGQLLWPIDATREVLYGYRRWLEQVPQEVTSAVGMLHLPDAPFVPEPMRGQSFARICLCHSGPDFSRIDQLLRPLRGIPGLLADLTALIPFTRADEITQDPVDPLPYTLRSEMLAELSDSVIDHLVEIAPRGAEPYILVLARHVAGLPASTSGLAYTNGAFALEAISVVPDEGAMDAARAFGERLSAGVASAATGSVPFNFMTGPDQVPLAYSDEHAERLAQLKKRYDPTGMFGGDRALTPTH